MEHLHGHGRSCGAGFVLQQSACRFLGARVCPVAGCCMLCGCCATNAGRNRTGQLLPGQTRPARGVAGLRVTPLLCAILWLEGRAGGQLEHASKGVQLAGAHPNSDAARQQPYPPPHALVHLMVENGSSMQQLRSSRFCPAQTLFLVFVCFSRLPVQFAGMMIDLMFDLF